MFQLWHLYFILQAISLYDDRDDTFPRKMLMIAIRHRFYIFTEMGMALNMNNAFTIRSKSKT